MSKQNLDILLIKDLDTLQELDEKAAQTIGGGTDWICWWPEDPTGAYYPSSVGSGNYVSEGMWHYFDYTQAQWINTSSPCYPVGIIAST